MGARLRRMQTAITPTRLGCYGRDPHSSGEGIRIPSGLAGGVLVYGDLTHRTFVRAGCAAEGRLSARVVGAHSFVESLVLGRHFAGAGAA